MQITLFDSELSKLIAQSLLDVEAIKLQPDIPFTWASGWKSPIYCDNRVSLSFPETRTKIKDALVRQLYLPVRWSECIQFMTTQGIESFVECGPGKVLSGLNRRIDRAVKSYSVSQISSLNQTVEALS